MFGSLFAALSMESEPPESMSDQASPGAEGPRKRRRLPNLVWPGTEIPVEIFDEITEFLSRQDVKSMRLVSRDFEEKVSAKYFRNVVVPFRSEMFNAPTTATTGGSPKEGVMDSQACSDALLSSGMRIFQSFGNHILRFALSLELDENSLAYPPIKPTQKAVRTYWGIYRWPHASYLRYSELEGLEQTADETGYMKDALNCLSKLKELGLCCDAGLGYLSGPDQNLESPPAPHPVFGLRNSRYQTHQRPQEHVEVVTRDARQHASEKSKDFKYTVLESMVTSAGYAPEQTEDAIGMLLSTEGASMTSIDFDERSYLLTCSRSGEIECLRAVTTSTYPLQPRSLTTAQKEMLLELEWAHRALVQSYVIAVIDNGITSTFNCLTTLTIAKIPSSHVYMLQRHEFWGSLPNLTNLAIAVVADWRKVRKVADGYLTDNAVSPVEAVSKVFRLLREYISGQRNISHLHFEWICGGEFAPGLTQRNRFVLPAPFVTPSDMVLPNTASLPDRLLSLPHVEHLSLKNCYFTPHVLVQVLRSMALSKLQKLELESVSLTGPPSMEPLILHPHQHAALQAVQGVVTAMQLANTLHHHINPALLPPGYHAIQNPPAAAAPVDPIALDPDWEDMRLGNPKLFCWAGIIDHLTPGPKLRELLRRDSEGTGWVDQPAAPDVSLQFLPESAKLIQEQKRYQINHLSFKSCGYVSIEATFINSHHVFAGPVPWIEATDLVAKRKELGIYMQTCSDKLAARIINGMNVHETNHLATAFDMNTTWTGVYDDDVIQAAVNDGIVVPGKGRFSGVITERKREESDLSPAEPATEE